MNLGTMEDEEFMIPLDPTDSDLSGRDLFIATTTNSLCISTKSSLKNIPDTNGAWLLCRKFILLFQSSPDVLQMC